MRALPVHENGERQPNVREEGVRVRKDVTVPLQPKGRGGYLNPQNRSHAESKWPFLSGERIPESYGMSYHSHNSNTNVYGPSLGCYEKGPTSDLPIAAPPPLKQGAATGHIWEHMCIYKYIYACNNNE